MNWRAQKIERVFLLTYLDVSRIETNWNLKNE